MVIAHPHSASGRTRALISKTTASTKHDHMRRRIAGDSPSNLSCVCFVTKPPASRTESIPVTSSRTHAAN